MRILIFLATTLLLCVPRAHAQSAPSWFDDEGGWTQIDASTAGDRGTRLWLSIDQDGMYSIGADAAREAGWKFPVSLDSIALRRDGHSIPIGWTGDGVWANERDADVIWFFGLASRGAATTDKPVNPAWKHLLERVETKDGPQRSMRYRREYLPAGTTPKPLTHNRLRQRHEKNFTYARFANEGDATDFYYWTHATPGTDPELLKFEFWLSDYFLPAEKEYNAAGGGTLRVKFYGLSSADNTPDHLVNVSLNGKQVGQAAWEKRVDFTLTVPIPRSALGVKNVLSLEFPEDRLFTVDDIRLDWFEIDIPFGFDARLGETIDLHPAVLSPGDWQQARIILAQTEILSVIDIVDGIEYPGTLVKANERDGKPANEIALNWRSPKETGPYPALPFGEVPLGSVSWPAPRFRIVDTTRPKRIDASKMHRVLGKNVSGADALHLAQKSLPNGVAPNSIILSHSMLMEPARALALHRAMQGYTLLVVNLDEVFLGADPNNGWFSDTAVKAWIQDYWDEAKRTGARSPQFLTLMGDSTFDYRGIYKDRDGMEGGSNLLPAPWFEAPQWYMSGFVADNNYGCLEGDDDLPELAIGRLPADEPAQAWAYLEKIKEYEAAGNFVPWKERALLVSSWETSFSQLLKDTANRGLGRFLPTTLIAELDSAPDDVANMVGALNEGCGVLYYVGHGGAFVWRVGPVDYDKQKDLFTPREIESLTNASAYPIVFVSSCYSTSFDNKRSLGEVFIFAPERGGIAVIGSPWKTSVSPNHSFNTWMMNELFQLDPKKSEEGNAVRAASKLREGIADHEPIPLGLAFREAKRSGSVQGEAMVGFTLLGDPMLLVWPVTRPMTPDPPPANAPATAALNDPNAEVEIAAATSSGN